MASKQVEQTQTCPKQAGLSTNPQPVDVIYGYEDPDRNLLRNWDFEEPISKHDWKVSNADFSRVQDSYTGDWSLHIHTRRHKHANASQRVTGLKPGTSYYYSCFLKFLTHVEGRNYFKTRMFVSIKLKNQDKLEKMYIGRLSFQRAPTPWHQLGGDFVTPDAAIQWVEVHLDLEDHCVDYLLDTASLIELPADPDWKQTLDKEIQKQRTSTVNLNINFPDNVKPRQYLLKVRQKKLEFGFGGGIVAAKFNEDSEFGEKYRACFFDHFEWAVFINDTKWKQMERHKGKIKYESVEKAVDTLHRKGITVRAHAIHWNRMESCPDWVHSLQGEELQKEIDRRVNVVKLFKGKFVQWDVCNEHLHNHFFEQNTSNHNQLSRICRQAHKLDPDCHLYLNDYQLVRTGELTSAQTNLARDLLSEDVPIHGIGIQSHLRVVPIPVEILQKRMQILAAVGLPLMLTEFSVHTYDVTQRARSLEEALYVYFSNPSVAGITFWTFSDIKGITMGDDDMALFEGPNFEPNEAGKAFRSLLKKWRTNMDIQTGSHHSRHTINAYHGQYELEVIHKGQTVWSRSFKVIKGKSLDLDVDIDLSDPEYCSGYLDRESVGAVCNGSSGDSSGDACDGDVRKGSNRGQRKMKRSTERACVEKTAM